MSNSIKVFSDLTNVTQDTWCDPIEVLRSDYDPTPGSPSISCTSGKVWASWNLKQGSGIAYPRLQWSPDQQTWMDPLRLERDIPGIVAEIKFIYNLTSDGGASDATVTVDTLNAHRLVNGDQVTIIGGPTGFKDNTYYVKILSYRLIELYGNSDLQTDPFQMTTAEADAYTANSSSFYNQRYYTESQNYAYNVFKEDVYNVSTNQHESSAYQWDVAGNFVRFGFTASTADSLVIDAWIGAV